MSTSGTATPFGHGARISRFAARYWGYLTIVALGIILVFAGYYQPFTLAFWDITLLALVAITLGAILSGGGECPGAFGIFLGLGGFFLLASYQVGFAAGSLHEGHEGVALVWCAVGCILFGLGVMLLEMDREAHPG